MKNKNLKKKTVKMNPQDLASDELFEHLQKSVIKLHESSKSQRKDMGKLLRKILLVTWMAVTLPSSLPSFLSLSLSFKRWYLFILERECV